MPMPIKRRAPDGSVPEVVSEFGGEQELSDKEQVASERL